MTFPSELARDDFDRCGFMRDELMSFLAAKGIHLDDHAKKSRAKAVPEWARACSAIKRYSLRQAARIVLGIDPLDQSWYGGDVQRDFDKALTALSHAVEDGELMPCGKRDDEEVFQAQELKSWAESVGMEWCIPTAFSSSASVLAGLTDEALLKKYRESERLRVELLHEVETLRAKIKTNADQAEKLADLTANVGRLEAENANAKAEIDRLKTEIGNGKVVATWQKMVIGVAVDSYSYDPNATRSTVPTEIANDLAKVGISLDVDTIRARLKEAANAHLPKT